MNYVSESSQERAEKVAKDIEGNGTRALVCRADVSKLGDIPKLVEAALKISPTGKIDILIHKYVLIIAASAHFIFSHYLTYPFHSPIFSLNPTTHDQGVFD